MRVFISYSILTRGRDYTWRFLGRYDRIRLVYQRRKRVLRNARNFEKRIIEREQSQKGKKVETKQRNACKTRKKGLKGK